MADIGLDIAFMHWPQSITEKRTAYFLVPAFFSYVDLSSCQGYPSIQNKKVTENSRPMRDRPPVKKEKDDKL